MATTARAIRPTEAREVGVGPGVSLNPWSSTTLNDVMRNEGFPSKGSFKEDRIRGVIIFLEFFQGFEAMDLSWHWFGVFFVQICPSRSWENL